MITDYDPSLSPEKFGSDYYFVLESSKGYQRITLKEIGMRARISSLFQDMRSKYGKYLVKAYFHSLQTIVTESHSFSLSSASSSSSSGSSATELPGCIDGECQKLHFFVQTIFHAYFRLTNITFGTWNLGGPTDFIRSLPQYHPEIVLPEWKEEPFPTIHTITPPQYEMWNLRRLELVKKRIEAMAPDILCMQEINENDIKRLSQWMIEKHFSIVSDGIDAAILFRADRFVEIDREIQSGKGRTSVLVKLEEIIDSKEKFWVGSAHISGFSLAHPEQPFGISQGREYHQGDQELQMFVKELASVTHEVAACFFGIDANSTEKIHLERLAIPLFAGFKRSTENDGKTTAFNPDLGEANLDHLYWSKGDCAKVHFTPLPLEEQITPPSDHKIVSGTLTIVREKNQ